MFKSMHMNEQDYIKERIDNQFDWYDKKSQSNQKIYKRLKLLEILASVLIPFLSGYLNNDKVSNMGLIIGILGLTIAFIEGTLYLYNFQENWLGYRKVAEFLKREKFLYLTASGPYENNKTLNALVMRIENYTENENQEWVKYSKEEGQKLRST